MEWQPIETAPKGNEEILVYHAMTDEQFVVWFNSKDERWQFSQHDQLKDNPSHWMPLPEAPK